MACLLYGSDQGVGPMVSLNEISVVQGRPTMSANLMSAKARANGHKISRVEIRDKDGDIIGVTAKGVRSDGTEDEVTWTLKDAERAGLAGKSNWKTYPRQMLWARAVSELCRALFSDTFLGAVYTEEEIGATLDQHDALDAEYVEVSAPTSPQIPGADSGGTEQGRTSTAVDPCRLLSCCHRRSVVRPGQAQRQNRRPSSRRRSGVPVGCGELQDRPARRRDQGLPGRVPRHAEDDARGRADGDRSMIEWGLFILALGCTALVGMAIGDSWALIPFVFLCVLAGAGLNRIRDVIFFFVDDRWPQFLGDDRRQP
jgi:hypothetical protein